VTITTGILQVGAGAFHTWAVKKDNSLWCWGWNKYGQVGDGTYEDKTYPVEIMKGIIDVSAGGSHTCAIKQYGSLWCWGANEEGQLGDRTKLNRYLPYSIMKLKQ
jgi:alpha-tubulin suppressor-like RCC1 family protein